jgi:hypothetical protein
MIVEEYIRSLRLHDMPVHGINFDLRNRRLIIHYSPYVEDSKSYRDETLTFCGIENIGFNGWDATFEIEEITNADILKTESGYHAEILFLCGSGGPGWQLNFDFISIDED